MRAFNAAALVAAEAVMPADQVHLAGQVPATPKTPYLVLSVGSGRPENYLSCGRSGSKAYRLVVMAVGADIDEVGFAVEKADAAFEDEALTVAGFDCGPCIGDERVASPVIRDQDLPSVLTCTVLYPFYAHRQEIA